MTRTETLIDQVVYLKNSLGFFHTVKFLFGALLKKIGKNPITRIEKYMNQKRKKKTKVLYVLPQNNKDISLSSLIKSLENFLIS